MGAKFAQYGLQATVTTEPAISETPDCDVLVIDTETRHVSGSEAYESVRQILVGASRFHPATVYKKTDSTLRGNIAAELRALQSVFPTKPLIFAPAYVAMGRTVKDGYLYVAGKLIHETEFANDPLNPVRESNIRALLNNERISVLDAESHDDTREAARLIVEADPKPMSAGPAALAEALAVHLNVETSASNPLPILARCLVINGSLHPISHEQIIVARSQGCFRDGWLLFDERFGSTGLERAKDVGRRVQALLRSSNFDGLIVFGGDTAFGIHQALNAPNFDSMGEVLPGIPVSRSGGLVWITKAGGFGPPDVLSQIRERLNKSTC